MRPDQSGDEQVVVVEALKGDTKLQLQQNIQSNYLQEILLLFRLELVLL